MSEHSYDYVIVGNSTAAIAAVESLRRVDTEGSLAVISDEPQAAYCSPLITYVLAGKIEESNLNYRPADFYDKLHVDTYLGNAAVSLDPAAHEVKLEDGTTLGYRKLLLANGGEPIVPNMPGTNLQGVFTFTRYSDMCRVRDFIAGRNVQEAVVVGGGMIGVKTAEALAACGVRTTMVELQDRILSAALDPAGSAAAQRALEKAGIRVLTSVGATALEGAEGSVRSVRLDDGTMLHATLVVVAIGVRPSKKLAEDAGLATNRGVLVDDQGQTSDEDIYAAGDVAEAYDVLLGETRPVAIWPNAYLQGQVAGSNMAGEEKRYDGAITMNSIQICGLPTISVGLTTPGPQDEVLDYSSPDGLNYRRIVLRGGRIVGAVFVGEIERAGIITGLIREGIEVTEFKQKLIGRELGLLALPKEYRKHKVTGPGIEV
jgi:NAD(P)H-nitrite reductase large subunit